MTENDWDQLFNLISKVVNLDGLTAEEKGRKIREEAEARGQLVYLDEFVEELIAEDDEPEEDE